MELDPDIRTAVFWHGYSLDPGSGTSQIPLTAASSDTAAPPTTVSPEQLAAALASLDPTGLGDGLIQVALGRSVDAAMYWQEPDGEDMLAGLPVIRAALVPLAEQIMTSPHTQWWERPRRTEQWAVDWRSAEDPAPLPKDPRHTLTAWARNVRAEEVQAARERPRDPRANVSGTWWSIPHGLVHTVGCLPAGLSLVEDSLGWEEATAVPVRGTGKTFEIRTADDWVSLCRRFPLEVTASRRHDWFRVTDRKSVV